MVPPSPTTPISCQQTSQAFYFRFSPAKGAKTPEDIHSLAIKLSKLMAFVAIADKFEVDQAMVFVRTKLDASNLHKYLRSLGASRIWRDFDTICADVPKHLAFSTYPFLTLCCR